MTGHYQSELVIARVTSHLTAHDLLHDLSLTRKVSFHGDTVSAQNVPVHLRGPGSRLLEQRSHRPSCY